MPVLKTSFPPSTENVTMYSLSNESQKLFVNIIDYGATIVQILFHDRYEVRRDLVLGFDQLGSYKSGSNPYFGATIGRVANRIGNASFQLNGRRYDLYKNNGTNSLHGGLVGFDKRKWKLVDESYCSITLQYSSYDGEEGYPGTLDTQIRFVVTELNELLINYQAKLRDLLKSDPSQQKQTIVSLTNHSYFNLSGACDSESLSILDHKVRLYSNEYLEVDQNLIPTGKILPVHGSPLEFNIDHKQSAMAIGDRGFQYDHCYVLENDSRKWCYNQQRKQSDDDLKLAAEVYSPRTGIKMTFRTNEPSFQFYISGSISQGLKPKQTQDQTNKVHGFKKLTLGKNSGFCLEAQRFPNAINHEKWRSQVILDPNGLYIQNTVYKFELNDQI